MCVCAFKVFVGSFPYGRGTVIRLLIKKENDLLNSPAAAYCMILLTVLLELDHSMIHGYAAHD